MRCLEELAFPRSHLGKQHVNQLAPLSREEALPYNFMTKVRAEMGPHRATTTPASDKEGATPRGTDETSETLPPLEQS